MNVKKLHPDAILPTVAHPGEDLGFDLYALETALIHPGSVAKVRTGLAVQMRNFGFILKDRSSLASQGIFTHGGVIDEGYRGEIVVLMSSLFSVQIQKGQKIAQMVPQLVYTDYPVVEVTDLPESDRGAAGFGSTGR